jgi:hypothetical protein
MLRHILNYVAVHIQHVRFQCINTWMDFAIIWILILARYLYSLNKYMQV